MGAIWSGIVNVFHGSIEGNFYGLMENVGHVESKRFPFCRLFSWEKCTSVRQSSIGLFRDLCCQSVPQLSNIRNSGLRRLPFPFVASGKTQRRIAVNRFHRSLFGDQFDLHCDILSHSIRQATMNLSVPVTRDFYLYASSLGKSSAFRHYRCIGPAPNYIALLFPGGEVHGRARQTYTVSRICTLSRPRMTSN